MIRGWALFVLCAGLAPAQLITTVAGTDTILPAAGITAVNAPLRGAFGVAVDSAGNIYIADAADHVVARVSTSGFLTVVAGNGRSGFSGDGGPAVNASLSTPGGVALDSAGNLYIADLSDHRVRKVSGGVITTVAGNGTAAFSGDGGPAVNAALNKPTSVAVDRGGNLYIADSANNRIRRVSGGIITTFAGNGNSGFSGDNVAATSASLFAPLGVAVDFAGSLYIADGLNNRIRRVSNNIITTIAGNGKAATAGDGGLATLASIEFPVGVAVDSSGNVYIAAPLDEEVRKITNGVIDVLGGTGSQGFSGDGGPAAKAGFSSPQGVAVDSLGNVYVADDGNSRIRKISQGIVTTAAGNGGFTGDGGPAANATLNDPNGVAVDAAGNLFVADAFNLRVRKLADGNITTVAGNGNPAFSGDGGPATAAALFFPVAVAVDPSGNFYIAEFDDCRIRKVSAAGTITTVAGTGKCESSADSGSAATVALDSPGALAVDAAGNIYIADSGNNRVRKVSGGTITTVAGNGSPGYSGDGAPAVAATLRNPTGVAVDQSGIIYIADSGNHVIRRVAQGTITTIAGNTKPQYSGDGGPATSASLFFPEGLAVDSAGNLYIADNQNQRIRKVSGGIITTVAGNGKEDFQGDGGPAVSASLRFPTSVAVDSAGNLYIADSGNNRVRKVLLKATTSYQTTPATLSFSATAGGVVPGAQAITLSTAVAGMPFSASVDAPWLTVSPSAGSIPAALQVTADPTGLAAGSFQGAVTITAPNAVPATSTVRVTFTVQAATPPTLAVDNQGVSFTVFQGASPVSQSLRVLNTGGGPLPFTATASTTSGGSWLAISPATGSATPSAPASLALTATTGSLTPGTYTGAVTISGAGKTVTIPVTLSVGPPAATILLSQSALSFSTAAQGGAPLPQNFGILNTGQGSMSWTADATTTSGGNWLRISPTSGTVARPYLDVSLVNVSIDPATLGPGIYYGRIRVSAVAVNTPQLITVILNVLPVGFNPGPQVFPAGLIFTGVAGQTPGSQDVQVGNRTGQPVSFLSGIIGSGLSYLPTNATVMPTQPATVRVYPDFSKLAGASIQRGTITLQFSDGSPSQTIAVLMVAAPAGGNSQAAAERFDCGPSRQEPCPAAQPQATCANPGLQVLFRSPQPSPPTVNAVVGQSLTVEVQVSDGCGTLIGPGGQLAQVTLRFASGEPVPLTHVGNGIWQGSWRPLNAGSLLMQVVALAGQDANVVGGTSATMTANVSALAPRDTTPTVMAQGVVNAASIQGGVPIAPGGLITVYGLNLADSTGPSGGLPLPDQLNGARVMLGDQSLPILYTVADPAQLNVQVPYGVPVNTQYELTVRHGNAISVPQPLVVAAAQPGIFTKNQAGTGQGSIVKSDQVTLAEPGTPAAIGETIVIYCTGLGAVTPKVAEGQPAPLVPPLSTTDNPVTVMIGGKPAAVAFSGLTPGYAGLYQINAVIPSGIATGDSVPVVISVAGQTSPPVTIAVK